MTEIGRDWPVALPRYLLGRCQHRSSPQGALIQTLELDQRVCFVLGRDLLKYMAQAFPGLAWL